MKRLLLLVLSFSFLSASQAQEPLRLAVAGLSHGHVDWVFNRPAGQQDFRLVGIYEQNQELADRYAGQYKLDRRLFFTDLDKMLAQTKPEAVAAFGPISEHVAVVRGRLQLPEHDLYGLPVNVTVVEILDAAKESARLRKTVLLK